MTKSVLLSIETGGDASSVNGSALSDGTYVEEGTPKPDGRDHNREDWYLKLDGLEAARKARREKDERQRTEEEKVDNIRRLQETDPSEYDHQMKEYNLRLQGSTEEDIEKLNQPLPKEAVERTLEDMSALLQPHKTKQRKVPTAERTSRRLAHKPLEYGIFADPSTAPPVPKSLRRDPSPRKRNSADPRSYASFEKSISVKAAKPQGISKSGRQTRRLRS